MYNVIIIFSMAKSQTIEQILRSRKWGHSAASTFTHFAVVSKVNKLTTLLKTPSNLYSLNIYMYFARLNKSVKDAHTLRQPDRISTF